MPAPRLMSLQDWEALAQQSAFQPARMAAGCPISLRQLQRCFASRFGKTPRAWTRELRCRLACPLIAQGWSNRAVAIELGYADESHFCHEFKRCYGVSPQRFIRTQGAVSPVPESPLRAPAPVAASGRRVVLASVAFRQ